MCGPGMSAGTKQVEMECFGLLLLVAGGLDVVAACPLDNLCGTIAVLPMGKGHKRCLMQLSGRAGTLTKVWLHCPSLASTRLGSDVQKLRRMGPFEEGQAALATMPAASLRT